MNSFEKNTALSNESLSNARPDELAHYPIIHHQPIQWGEMDAFNHLQCSVEIVMPAAIRCGCTLLSPNEP